MNHVRLVAGRELMDAFRSRAYWIMMGILLAGAVALLVLPRLLDGGTSYDLGIVGEPAAGVEVSLEEVTGSLGAELEVVRLDDEAAARDAVTTDEVDAALVADPDDPRVIRRADTSETLLTLVGQAAAAADVRDQLAGEGIEAGRVEEVLATPPPREVTVDDEQETRSAVAYVVSLALFTGGMSVATGVAVEKSTRIAEVLVTIVRPSHLLAGKVLGIGASTGLLLVVLALPFLVALGLGEVSLPSVVAVDLVAAVVWFLLGYVTYATIFAALGALVDRQEDLGSVVTPVTGMLIASYVAALQAQAAPESLLARVTSLFPLSAPMVMPVRIAEQSVGPAEMALALAIGVATLVLLVWGGGRIYQRALLRGGRRLSLLEVLRG